MSDNKLRNLFIAGAVTLGAMFASSAPSSAEVRGGIYIGGPGYALGLTDTRSPRYYALPEYGGSRYYRNDRGYGYKRRANRCSAKRAVRKARRRGLRRAHIVRMGRRGVVVAGRKWGDRVVMGFDRSRHCRIRFVRAR